MKIPVHHSISRPRILLYGHSGSGNRGCEAIVRSTAQILTAAHEGAADIRVASVRPHEDVRAGIPFVSEFVPHRAGLRRGTPAWIARQFVKRIARNPMLAEEIGLGGLTEAARSTDICLSVGGDNYCYGKPYWLYATNRLLRQIGRKTVLWSCSIEPDLIDEDMLSDLAQFDLITARESITYGVLMERGISRNTKLYPECAFAMRSDETTLPDGWQEGNMIGINLSPLIAGYERRKGIALQSTAGLIKHILDTSSYGVALIPHVTWRESNDLVPLSQIHRAFSHSGRVILVAGGYRAPQLKHLISRCKLFVGARTHATIAAYSTGVPALAIGYSVKAKGIARDLFGDERGLVVPIQELDSEQHLIAAFEAFRERESELRIRLKEIMPGYVQQAIEAGTEVARVLA